MLPYSQSKAINALEKYLYLPYLGIVMTDTYAVKIGEEITVGGGAPVIVQFYDQH